MSDREKRLNTYISRVRQAEDILKSKGVSYADSSFIWQVLQIEFDCIDMPTNLVFKDLSVIEIVEIVLKQKEIYGQPICEITIEDSILSDSIDDLLIKAHIKFKGEKWVVHKNDKDSFPSNPHAHNFETNTKLHLGSGQVFGPHKRVCGGVRKKDLIKLRQEILQRLPSLELPELE